MRKHKNARSVDVFADYVVMRFRRETNLWFDECTDEYKSAIECTSLTDGDNSLCLGLYYSRDIGAGLVTSMFEEDQLTVSIHKYLDVPQSYDFLDLRKLALSCFGDFHKLSDLQKRVSTISMLVMEVRIVAGKKLDEAQLWLSNIAGQLNGRLEYYPGAARYKLNETEPASIFAQIIFGAPIEQFDVINSLSRDFVNAEGFAPGQHLRLKSASTMRVEHGISGLSIMSRRF